MYTPTLNTILKEKIYEFCCLPCCVQIAVAILIPDFTPFCLLNTRPVWHPLVYFLFTKNWLTSLLTNYLNLKHHVGLCLQCKVCVRVKI